MIIPECYSCKKNLSNPFYMTHLGIYSENDNKLALSCNFLFLCGSDLNNSRIKNQKTKLNGLSDQIFFAIDSVTGLQNYSEYIMTLDSMERHLQYKFFDLDVSYEIFPEYVKRLSCQLKDWIEFDFRSSTWIKSEWAHKLYNEIRERS